jgi:hypothetical protein
LQVLFNCFVFGDLGSGHRALVNVHSIGRDKCSADKLPTVNTATVKPHVFPAIHEPFTFLKLTSFNRDVTVQEVNEFSFSAGFSFGFDFVFHGKGRLEGKDRGASLFLCDCLFQFANLLNRLRHASGEIVNDCLASSAAKVVVVNAKLAFGFLDFGDLLFRVSGDTGEESGFVGGKRDIHGKGMVEGKWKVASFIL